MNALNTLLQVIGRAFRWWVFVCPWERCLRIRAGKHQKELGPGLHILIPFLDRAFVHSTRLRLSNVPAQTLGLSGGRLLTVRTLISFTISDLSLLYKEVHDAEDGILDRVAVLVAKHRGAVSPEALGEKVQADADFSDWGLTVSGISVTDWVISTRSYRLLTDKLTEHPWSNKLTTSGDGARGRGHE